MTEEEENKFLEDYFEKNRKPKPVKSFEEKIKELKEVLEFCNENKDFKDDNLEVNTGVFWNCFYNYKKSYWQFSLTLKVLKNNNIPLNLYTEIFEIVIEDYHKRFKKGKKTNYKYLEQLKEKSLDLIKHKKEINVIDSLESLAKWKNQYTNITDEHFIDFLFENIDFNLSKNTLKTYYKNKI